MQVVCYSEASNWVGMSSLCVRLKGRYGLSEEHRSDQSIGNFFVSQLTDTLRLFGRRRSGIMIFTLCNRNAVVIFTLSLLDALNRLRHLALSYLLPTAPPPLTCPKRNFFPLCPSSCSPSLFNAHHSISPTSFWNIFIVIFFIRLDCSQKED